MADRSAVFFNTSTGSFTGISETTPDDILAGGLKRTSGSVTIDAGGANSVFIRTNGSTVLTVTSGGQLQTTSTATIAAIRLGSLAGDPSSLANGDTWYNSTTNKFRARENGATVDMISAGGGGGWTDDGANVRLTTAGDTVSIGTATASGKFRVFNTTDIINLRLDMVAAQTASIIEAFTSVGASVFSVAPSGAVTSADVNPITDDSFELGTIAARWGGVHISSAVAFRLTASAANAAATYGQDITMGAGGASAVDVRMRRTAASTFTFDNASTGAATVVPAVDSQNNLGTATLRWSQVNSNAHSVYAASGDANPTVQITTGTISYGNGGGTALDTRLRRSGGAVLTLDTPAAGSANLVPGADLQNTLGSSALRWSTTVVNTRDAYAAASDANPAMRMNTLGLFFGAGGASALDTRIRRTAASTLTIDNNSTGGATVVPAADNVGSIGTASLRWNLVRATTVTSGDLNLFDEERGAMWTLREEPDCITAINRNTGKRYKLALEEIVE